jgi:hypothetical protein
MKKHTERITLSDLFDNTTLDDVIEELKKLKNSHPNTEKIYINFDYGYEYEGPYITIEC